MSIVLNSNVPIHCLEGVRVSNVHWHAYGHVYYIILLEYRQTMLDTIMIFGTSWIGNNNYQTIGRYKGAEHLRESIV